MTRVVGVHGAFQELWGPNEVAARWLPAIRDGLWHAGIELDADRVVFQHLDPTPLDGLGAWPGPVIAWTNVAAIGDVACSTPKLAERFGPRVSDFAVDNGHRAHDPEPYLNAAATGHAVAAGLAR